jgi:hypothetical protein
VNTRRSFRTACALLRRSLFARRPTALDPERPFPTDRVNGRIAHKSGHCGYKLRARADSHAGFRSATPLRRRLNGDGREFEDVLVLQVGVGSAVAASLARQIENAVDCPDRVDGAGVTALERHLARPVVADPVLVA